MAKGHWAWAVVPLLAPLLFAVMPLLLPLSFVPVTEQNMNVFSGLARAPVGMDTRFHRKQRDGTVYSRERAG